MDPEVITAAGNEWLRRERTDLIRSYGEQPSPGCGFAQNEFALTRNLVVPGALFPDEMDARETNPHLIYRNAGLSALRALRDACPADVPFVLRVAESLLQTIGRLHTAGVLHLAINPFNILLPAVLLTGFGRAVCMNTREEQPDLRAFPREYWPYLAPEQTGRTGLRPDVRSDYYALGATLYELMAGFPPVAPAGIDEVIHSILARHPAPLREIARGVPDGFSAVVMKLLAKDPGDRFQSAGEILRSLTRRPEPSATSRRKAPRTGFVGRVKERARIADIVAQVRAGGSAVVSVSGFSGTGKTTLVHEAALPAVRESTVFLAGKFEQASSAPYAGFVQACDAYLRNVLSRPESELHRWEEEIPQRLGDVARDLMGVFPKLDSMAGLPANGRDRHSETPTIERKRRFQRAVERLFRGWTEAGFTIVLFLDDLQWADSASLELCLTLAEAGIPKLLIIIAYRENEIPPGHPLRPLIAEIEEKAGDKGTLSLGSLKSGDIAGLVKAIAPGLAPAAVAALTRYMEIQTGGNPLFILQQLIRLRDRRSLFYDFLGDRWLYQAQETLAEAPSRDVIAFLAMVMRELSLEEQSILSATSFLSRGASAHLISLLTDIPAERVARRVQGLTGRYLVVDPQDGASQDVYRLSHDNIRQAAMELVPPDMRPALHLRVGRLLRSSCNEGSKDSDLYEIVEQLNAGACEITDNAERQNAAGLDLRAGTTAKRAGSFSAAAAYLMSGVALLPDDGWEKSYQLALSLFEEAAEAEFLVGEYGRMNELIDTVIRKTASFLDSVRAYEIRIQSFVAMNKLREASRLSFDVAGRLGFHHANGKKTLVTRVRRLYARVLFRRFRLSYAESRPMKNPVALAALRVLLRGYTPTITASADAVLSLATEAALITLQYGVSSYAPAALAALGMVCVSEGKIDEGYRIGKLALQLQSQIDSPASRAETQTIDNFFIKPWKLHNRDILAAFLEAMETGIRAGEYEHAALAGHFYSNFAAFSGMQLADVDREICRITAVIDGLHQARSSIGVRRHHQYVLNLMRETPGNPPYVFAGPAFEDATMLPLLEAAKDSSALAILFTYKTILAYLFDEMDQAVEFGQRAADLVPRVPAQITVHIAVFYHALVLLSAWASHGVDAGLARGKVRVYLRSLRKWARSSPINFRHRHDLVLAEYLAVRGRRRAEAAFLQAVREAAASRYIQDEALAHRRLAHYYAKVGREQAFREHLKEAHRLYQEWGATAIVHNLEQRNPWLAEQRPEPALAAHAPERGAPPDLDAETLMNAGRIISSQTEIDSLLEQVIRIIMQCAGATMGVLEIERDGSLVASFEGSAAREGVTVRKREGAECRRLDVAAANLVRQTREPVVSGSRNGTNGTSAARSILCAPLLHRTDLKGIVYLENSLAAGVFTPQRLRIVELLAAQAAASFENASLYRLKDALAEQREQLLRADRLASLGALIAGVAHEVSSPNHVIRLDIDFLREKSARVFAALREAEGESGNGLVDEELPVQFDRAVRRISDASARIEGMVEELKGFARGGERSPLQPVDLNEIVESTLRLSETLIHKSTERFNVHLTQRLPKIKGDFRKLQQLLLNLVENACQALTSRDQGISLRTAYRRSADRVVLTVADEGRGIRSADLPKVTEPFFSTRRAEGGTGLGLAIADGIVRAHEGTLSIRSRAGAGTKVVILFPATSVPRGNL